MKTLAPVIIGTATRRYEFLDAWATVPPGLALGTTHGVVEDSHGRIFIHHTGAQSVVIFEPDGSFDSSWGDEYQGGAHGMYLSREPDGEFLYLSATKLGFVAKTTLDGRELFRIETPNRPDIYDEKRAFVPTETAVAPDGRIYIADGYGQPWVHVYSREPRYLTSFGGLGSGTGQLNNPHGIKIDTRGPTPRVLVCDRGNSRLQYFSLEGDHLGFVAGDLRKPCTTYQWRDELYVPDLYSRLTVLNGQDRLIGHLGDWPERWQAEGWPNLSPETWVRGKFSSPHDLHVDAQGNIYVVEWLSAGTPKITKLRRV